MSTAALSNNRLGGGGGNLNHFVVPVTETLLSRSFDVLIPDTLVLLLVGPCFRFLYNYVASYIEFDPLYFYFFKSSVR